MRIIDFHTHILPCVDHGSNSIEVSKKQIELASRAFVDTIISTSHFYPHTHTVDGFLRSRQDGYNAIKAELCENLSIILGAEVLLCEGLDRLDGLDKLCIGKSRVLLLELPFNNFSDGLYDTIERIIGAGYTVVLAHADRYDEDIIDNITRLNAKIQLNADAFCTIFKRKKLYEWIDAGLVVGIGSDIHMVDKKAYKCFGIARSRIGEDRFADIMQMGYKLIFE